MRDQRQPSSSIIAFLLTLLAATPTALAGDLPLVEAARNQDQQQIRTLLNLDIDVNVRSEDGSTALLWAAHWNDLATAGLLIRAGADANAANARRHRHTEPCP